MRAELRNCVKVEVAGWAPVPNKPTVSVDVKQHPTKNNNNNNNKKAQDRVHGLVLETTLYGIGK